MDEKLKGTLRAIGPALVTYFVAKGWMPEALSGPVTELVTVILTTLAAVGWSIWDKRRSAKAAGVAAMSGTVVSPDGKTITLVDRDLAVAAKEAATPASGVVN